MVRFSLLFPCPFSHGFPTASSSIVDNSATADLVKTAEELTTDNALSDGPEVAYRKIAGDLQAEIIRNSHSLDYLIKHRKLLVDELARVHRHLDILPSA